MAKAECKYCLQQFDTRGLLSHIYFKHRTYVLREFATNPVIWGWMWAHGLNDGPPKLPLGLPAPRSVDRRCECGHLERSHTDVISICPWRVACRECFCENFSLVEAVLYREAEPNT